MGPKQKSAMYYAYIRVSTQEQSCSSQKFEISNWAQKKNVIIDKWIMESVSGTVDAGKRKLGKLIRKMKPGDVIVATEISRLGRNMLMIMGILNDCAKRQICILTIKDNFELSNNINSKIIAFAFALAAEIERNLISQRTKASLDNIKATGKRLGRPFAAQSRKLKLSRNTKKVKELLDMGLTRYRIAKIMDVKPSTVSNFIQRMGW